MALFERYETEFQRQISIIHERIEKLSNFYGERRKIAIEDTRRLIEDLKKTYQYMEDESSVAGRSSYVSKLRGYSSDIIRVQRDVDHASLMEATFLQTNEFIDEFQLRDVEQRTRLLSSSNILDEGSKRLVNANRIALETEDIGANVLSELSSQKQTILRARDNLDLIEDNISRSRRILLKMSRRIATDKFVLMGIILLLLLVISLIVYFKWLRHLI